MSEKRIGDETWIVASVKAKKDGVRVSFSNGEKMVLSVDSFTEFHLYENKELSAEEVQRILDYSNMDQAYAQALRYLGHDLYSCAELRRKLLAKGYGPETVGDVIKRLLDAKLLDDRHYAEVFAFDVADLRLIGRTRIVYELRVNGIPDSIISSLEFPREAELDKATRLGESYNRRYVRTPHAKRVLKINQALLAKGFDESVAHEAATSVATPDDPDVERGELEKYFNLAKAKYERKYKDYDLRNRVFAYLVRKGFPYEDIKSYLEEQNL